MLSENLRKGVKNRLDHEKAFGSVDRQTTWRLLRHYGLPEKMTTNTTKKSDEGVTSRVVHGQHLTVAFQVKT